MYETNNCASVLTYVSGLMVE